MFIRGSNGIPIQYQTSSKVCLKGGAIACKIIQHALFYEHMHDIDKTLKNIEPRMNPDTLL